MVTGIADSDTNIQELLASNTWNKRVGNLIYFVVNKNEIKEKAKGIKLSDKSTHVLFEMDLNQAISLEVVQDSGFRFNFNLEEFMKAYADPKFQSNTKINVMKLRDSKHKRPNDGMTIPIDLSDDESDKYLPNIKIRFNQKDYSIDEIMRNTSGLKDDIIQEYNSLLSNGLIDEEFKEEVFEQVPEVMSYLIEKRYESDNEFLLHAITFFKIMKEQKNSVALKVKGDFQFPASDVAELSEFRSRGRGEFADEVPPLITEETTIKVDGVEHNIFEIMQNADIQYRVGEIYDNMCALDDSALEERMYRQLPIVQKYFEVMGHAYINKSLLKILIYLKLKEDEQDSVAVQRRGDVQFPASDVAESSESRSRNRGKFADEVPPFITEETIIKVYEVEHSISEIMQNEDLLHRIQMIYEYMCQLGDSAQKKRICRQQLPMVKEYFKLIGYADINEDLLHIFIYLKLKTDEQDTVALQRRGDVQFPASDVAESDISGIEEEDVNSDDEF